MARQKTQKFTLYLLDHATQSVEDCLNPEHLEKLRHIGESKILDGHVDCHFYALQGESNVPKWVKTFEEISGHRANVSSASCRGALVLRFSGPDPPEDSEKWDDEDESVDPLEDSGSALPDTSWDPDEPNSIPRFVLITAGIGSQYLVNPNLAIDDFGLKVALNAIDPKRIRGLDSKTIDDSAKLTRIQASRDIPFGEYAFDPTIALLKGVSGEPRNEDFARRITGSTPAIIQAEIPVAEIPRRALDIACSYYSQNYKRYFRWLNSLRTAPRRLIPQLNTLLEEAVRAGNDDGFQLAPPVIIEPTEIEGYRYPHETARMPIHHEMTWADFVKSIGGAAEFSTNALFSATIRGIRSGGEANEHRWRAFNCVIAEVKHDDNTYVLTDGKWFRVRPSFMDEVDEIITGVTAAGLGFPAAYVDETEPAYNSRVGDSVDGWVSMDAKSVRPPLQAHGIELCDLLSPNNRFVHVKRKNSSSTMSHLFAQGRVSAELWLRDKQFRDAALEKVRETHGSFADQLHWNRDDLECQVTYALLAKPGTRMPQDLPFFSKVSYSHAVKGLTSSQIDVRYEVIEKSATRPETG